MVNEHVEEGLTSLKIKEMKIKTTMRYHLTFIKVTTIKKKQKIANNGKNVEKLKLLCIVGGNVKWFHHYEKQYGSSSKN